MSDLKFQLRDGSMVRDKRLARCVDFDERSRAFAMPLTAGRPLRSMTWKCPVRLDQGREGACVGFGLTHELAARPAPVPGQTNAKARARYKAAQKIDPWPGENYEGTSVLAGIKVCRKQGWFDGYRWAFGLDAALQGISFSGPAVLGTNVYAKMMSPKADGEMSPTGRKHGGHCWIADGIDVPNERVWFLNSWGRAWGIDGRAWMSFDNFGKLLKIRGEVAFLRGRHVSPRRRR